MGVWLRRRMEGARVMVSSSSARIRSRLVMRRKYQAWFKLKHFKTTI